VATDKVSSLDVRVKRADLSYKSRKFNFLFFRTSIADTDTINNIDKVSAQYDRITTLDNTIM